MERRAFLIAGLVTLGATRVRAQGKVARVGYLSMASPQADRHWLEALRQGLRKAGYVEGRNLVLELRHAPNDAARAAALAQELVGAGAQVLVVYASPVLPQLKKTVKVPIVMTVHADPVSVGVVDSLARPGGNITGLTDGHADLAPKRLELLKEVVPSVSRVGAMFNPATAHARRQLALAQQAAARLGIAMVPLEMKGAQDIERAFGAAGKERVDGLFLIPDPTWWISNEQRIAGLAAQGRLPAIGTVREFADRGILIAYGTNFAELWRKSASYVDKILKGAKPGELPIEHPTKFDLVINLKTARAIGVEVPRAVLLRADHVIE